MFGIYFLRQELRLPDRIHRPTVQNIREKIASLHGGNSNAGAETGRIESELYSMRGYGSDVRTVDWFLNKVVPVAKRSGQVVLVREFLKFCDDLLGRI